MSGSLYSTSAQTLTCFIRYQAITTLLMPIHIVRLDERTGNIYMLAGEELEITISSDGNWKFED